MSDKYPNRTRQMEFKTRAEGDDMVIEGYFIVFNKPYYIDDYMEEIVCPGAIDDRTDTSDVRGLVDHLPHLVLGRSTAKTLEWEIDDVGVLVRIKINKADADALNLYARVQRGDIDQASFGFDEDEVDYITLDGGRTRRSIVHISKLWEFSVCTFPAYEQTYVSARSKTSADIKRVKLAAEKEKLKRRFKHK